MTASKYATIQINKEIKNDFRQWCVKNNHLVSKTVEAIVKGIISGSIILSGSALTNR